MTDSPFSGYDLAPLPADDEDLAKWLAARNSDQSSVVGVLGDLLGNVTRLAVETMNVRVNRSVEYFPEAPGACVWKTPAQTWAQRTGDCKDYATLKYAALRLTGVPEDDMEVVCCELKSAFLVNPQHAFLVAVVEGAPLVIDSKFPQLIPPDEYDNCVPLKMFSGENGWLFSRTFAMSEIEK